MEGCLIEEGVFLGRNRVLSGLGVVVVVLWVLLVLGRVRSLLREGLNRDLERVRLGAC